MAELFAHASQHPLWAHRQALLVVAFGLMLLEMVALALRFHERYRPGLMLTTTAMWFVEQGGRLLMYPARLAAFAVVSSFSVWPVLHAAWTIAPIYLAVDFLYYWKHRLLHSYGWTWALHSVHHSSDDLNLMAAIRLGWLQRWLDDFFYLPLALLGFDPVLLLLTVELNHASQFWCHTRCIGRVAWLDGWLNTPSNHRVHHARERVVANSNYGSTLMCWDRWFGTYRAEPREGIREYGIEGAPLGLNPLRIQLAPLLRYFVSLRATAVPREP